VIAKDVVLGSGVSIPQPDLVNLYGCTVGDRTKIGTFVEVQKGAAIGNDCKISSHSFICSGVTIEDGVFIGHGVMFINDVYPKAVNPDGSLETEKDWQVVRTRIKARASIGSNATIIGGVVVGQGALVGAGAVVSRDVPDYAIVAGVPARVLGDVRSRAHSAGTPQGGA
jgi:UDP-2-acetamido-3-amino-2,3-dideoxy-glucuronate N-acetyltransferase